MLYICILAIFCWILSININIRIRNRQGFRIYIKIGGIPLWVNIIKMMKNKKLRFKELHKDFIKITNPLVQKIIENLKIRKCDLIISVSDEHPYVLYNLNMLFFYLSKKIKHKKLKLLIGKEAISYDFVLGINIWKMVKIIVSNYNDFRMLIKKEVSYE